MALSWWARTLDCTLKLDSQSFININFVYLYRISLSLIVLSLKITLSISLGRFPKMHHLQSWVLNESKNLCFTLKISRAPLDKPKRKVDEDEVITTPPKPVFCIYDSDEEEIPKIPRKFILHSFKQASSKFIITVRLDRFKKCLITIVS